MNLSFQTILESTDEDQTFKPENSRPYHSKSLIFMRRYENTDFHWHFLTIFCKMEASMKIKYLN